jgi:hypothetical protein
MEFWMLPSTVLTALNGFATGAGDDRLVCTTRVRNAIEAAEPVSDDPGTARSDLTGDFLDVLLREPPHAPQLLEPLEFHVRQASLKLYFIARHGASP